MFNDIFGDCIELIKTWKPKQKYNNENQYREDLMDFLMRKLNDNSNQVLFTPQRRISITKDDGRGLCDIGIDRKIGIELKKDLKSKRKIDTLIGQIVNEYLRYEHVIVVLVGNTDKYSLEILKDKISDLNEKYNNPVFNYGPKIRLIDKSGLIKEEIKKDSYDIFELLLS